MLESFDLHSSRELVLSNTHITAGRGPTPTTGSSNATVKPNTDTRMTQI